MTAPSAVDREQGRATAESILHASDWRHRKVESMRLLEGERGRRRVSLDCTPPPDPALAYYSNERAAVDITHVKGPVVVPVALISKVPMRHFDISDQSGQALPVLGSTENGALALSALVYLYENCMGGTTAAPALIGELNDIVLGAPADAGPRADDLVRTGRVGGAKVIDPLLITPELEALTKDLASNFLLTVLIPADAAGRRQLIKFSFHWRVVADLPPSLFRRLLVAAGQSSAPILIEINGAADAQSYHLEVHAPPGITCAGLTLPTPAGGSTHPSDEGTDLVAHAVASYAGTTMSDSTARLQLAVPLSGLRLVTLLVSLLTTLVFMLEEFLPGARATLLGDAGGAVGILLAVPAVVIALLARPGENAMASALLLPLRVVVLSCSALLGLAAASMVGQLHEPYITILWQVGAWNSAVVAAVLSVFALFVRG